MSARVRVQAGTVRTVCRLIYGVSEGCGGLSGGTVLVHYNVHVQSYLAYPLNMANELGIRVPEKHCTLREAGQACTGHHSDPSRITIIMDFNENSRGN